MVGNLAKFDTTDQATAKEALIVPMHRCTRIREAYDGQCLDDMRLAIFNITIIRSTTYVRVPNFPPPGFQHDSFINRLRGLRYCDQGE